MTPLKAHNSGPFVLFKETDTFLKQNSENFSATGRVT